MPICLYRYYLLNLQANTTMMIQIRNAEISDAPAVARLIMMAMTHECCQYFCGEGRGLDDFRRMMQTLVERNDSQYSYLNTIVAEDAGRVVGAIVAYDGGRLHELRRAFISQATTDLNKDHADIDDETSAGELYLDSLAVEPAFRRRGIATMLINAMKHRAADLSIGRVGLLVDKGNPDGEALYATCGFCYVNDSSWGGHAMKHLTVDV